MVTGLTTSTFKDFLRKNELVAVDFWAEWCGPCKIMSPVFEEMSKELTTMKFAKLNVDEEGEIAQQYDVSSIPTIIIFHKRQELSRIVGFIPKHPFKQKLQDAIKSI